MGQYKGADFLKVRIPAANVVATLALAIHANNASYQITIPHRAVGLIINNTLDQEVTVVMEGENAFDLAAGEGLYLSMAALGRFIDAGIIAVHYETGGVQPTTGSIRITVVK